MNCVSCDSDYENLVHLFFACPYAIQVWNRAGLWAEVDSANASISTAEETIFYLLQNLSEEQSQRLATILWSLWKHRNLKVWEDVTETCDVVVERARVLLEDWQLANGLRTLDQPVLQGV
jgi:ribonuclease HI